MRRQQRALTFVRCGQTFLETRHSFPRAPGTPKLISVKDLPEVQPFASE